MTTAEYILAHRTDDVRRLALAGPAGLTAEERRYALVQIAGWQAARHKLPTWAATDGIIYPEHLSIEQCSSEATAEYKAALIRRLVGPKADDAMADITGGLGVDFAALAPLFARTLYIERQEALCTLARHNFPLLSLYGAEIVCGDGLQTLAARPDHYTLIYADPARRNSHGGRAYAIADCTPDIGQAMPRLLEKADYVLVKLSPMLDHHKAAADIGHCVREVHIVAVGGECKELLIVAGHGNAEPTTTCAGDFGTLTFTKEEAEIRPVIAEALPMDNPKSAEGTKSEGIAFGCQDGGATELYIHEPDASVMKAGCYGLLCRRWGVAQLSPESHLFIGRGPAAGFPGRSMKIVKICGVRDKWLRTLTQANITCRGFGMTADELRQRLKLRDGGDVYLFAATTAKGRVIIAAKRGN